MTHLASERGILHREEVVGRNIPNGTTNGDVQCQGYSQRALIEETQYTNDMTCLDQQAQEKRQRERWNAFV